MKREQFLNLKIPVYPFCSISKGSKTKYHESIHIVHTSKDIQINILWNCEGHINIGTWSAKEKNPYKKTKTIATGKLSSKKILDTINTILSDKEK